MDITNLLKAAEQAADWLCEATPGTDQYERGMALRKEIGKVSVVHGCPPEGSGLTPCCGESPFELSPVDRMTNDPKLVTCKRRRK